MTLQLDGITFYTTVYSHSLCDFCCTL